MDVKTVALDPEAYNLLRRQKRRGESFSDVVKRIARNPRPLSDFAGAWKEEMSEEDIRKIKEALRKGKEVGKKRMADLVKRLG